MCVKASKLGRKNQSNKKLNALLMHALHIFAYDERFWVKNRFVSLVKSDIFDNKHKQMTTFIVKVCDPHSSSWASHAY